MSRRVTTWAAAAALLASGPACRMCNRDECSARRAPAGCDAVPTSWKRSAGGMPAFAGGGVVPAVPLGEMVSGGDSFPAYPTSFGGPSYPVGEPVPLRPTAAGPANELPYPSIPNPGVPENPSAVIPGAAARTTGGLR